MAFQHLHITCHLLAFSSLWDDLSRQIVVTGAVVLVFTTDWRQWHDFAMHFNMTCAVFDSVVVFGVQRLIPRATTIMNTQEREGGKGSFINFIKCSCAHMHSTSPKRPSNTYLTCFPGELWTRVLTNDLYNRITKVFNCLEVCNMSQLFDHFCGKIPAFVTIVNWAVVPTIRSTATPWWNGSANSYIQRGLYAKSSYPGRSCHLFWVLGNVTAVLLWSGKFVEDVINVTPNLLAN